MYTHKRWSQRPAEAGHHVENCLAGTPFEQLGKEHGFSVDVIRSFCPAKLLNNIVDEMMHNLEERGKNAPNSILIKGGDMILPPLLVIME